MRQSNDSEVTEADKQPSAVLSAPVAWMVTHYQDGTKRPNVSVTADEARARYVFGRYGPAAIGIKQGELTQLYTEAYVKELQASFECAMCLVSEYKQLLEPGVKPAFEIP